MYWHTCYVIFILLHIGRGSATWHVTPRDRERPPALSLVIIAEWRDRDNQDEFWNASTQSWHNFCHTSYNSEPDFKEIRKPNSLNMESWRENSTGNITRSDRIHLEEEHREKPLCHGVCLETMVLTFITVAGIFWTTRQTIIEQKLPYYIMSYVQCSYHQDMQV